MTIELIKQLMDTCYLAKRARDLLPPLPDGVTSSYIQYLDVIQRLEAKGVRARVSDLSDALNLPRPGVTRTVKEMERKGYLQKQVSIGHPEELPAGVYGVHTGPRLAEEALHLVDDEPASRGGPGALDLRTGEPTVVVRDVEPLAFADGKFGGKSKTLPHLEGPDGYPLALAGPAHRVTHEVRQGDALDPPKLGQVGKAVPRTVERHRPGMVGLALVALQLKVSADLAAHATSPPPAWTRRARP